MTWKFGALLHPDTAAAMEAELYAGDLLYLAKYPCGWCEERIDPEHEGGFILPLVAMTDRWLVAYHEECFIRTVVGSLGHLQRKCSCFVKDGPTVEDPPRLTKRQAARAAMLAAFSTAVDDNGGLSTTLST